ncbi:mobile mystery protein A [Pseudoxanthomonas putridarboris]
MSNVASRKSMLSVARRRLDETGRIFRDAGPRIRSIPSGGWIGAIREALGMSVQDFADRLGVTRATAAKLEANERRRTIQLDSLQRAADALGCDLIYALVPREPLQDMVTERRMAVLKSMRRRTQQNMRLEAQEVDDPQQEEHLLAQAELLVPDRLLWRKEK